MELVTNIAIEAIYQLQHCKNQYLKQKINRKLKKFISVLMIFLLHFTFNFI